MKIKKGEKENYKSDEYILLPKWTQNAHAWTALCWPQGLAIRSIWVKISAPTLCSLGKLLCFSNPQGLYACIVHNYSI